MLAAFTLALALAGASGAPTRSSQELPENEGWVTDLAGLLEPAVEAELESRMESYRAGSGHEIALLTLPDLGGEPIEHLALAVGRSWGIGDAAGDADGGALIVVAVAERKVRIEVGRGLEGALPDSIAGRIIRDEMAPHFKARDYPAGLIAGVDAVHAAIGGNYADPARSPSPAAPAIATFVALLIFLSLIGAFRRGTGRGYAGGLGRGVWVSPWLLGGGSGGGGHRGGGLGGGGLGGGGLGGGGFRGFSGGGNFGGGGATGGW